MFFTCFLCVLSCQELNEQMDEQMKFYLYRETFRWRQKTLSLDTQTRN